MKNYTKTIVWYATVAALIFVARMLDHVMTGWLSINAAIITLSVVYACIFIRPSWINAVSCGFIFGIMSLITSVMFPGGFTPYFVNPLVSVLPRVIVGVAVYGIYVLIKKLFGANGDKFEGVAIAVACIIGSLVNTATVMTMIFAFMRLEKDVTYGYVIGLVLTVNTLLEVLVPPAITPFTVYGVKRGLKFGDKK